MPRWTNILAGTSLLLQSLIFEITAAAAPVVEEPPQPAWRMVKQFGVPRLRQGSYIISLAFTADSKRLMSASLTSARVWDVRTGDELRAFRPPLATLAGTVLVGDNKTAVTVLSGTARDRNGRLFWWDLETGKVLKTADPLPFGVHDIAMMPDGEGLLVQDQGAHTIWLWDFKNGKQISDFGRCSSFIVVSPDGKLAFCAGSSDERGIIVWDVKKSERLLRYKVYLATPSTVAIAPDSRHAVSGGGGGNAEEKTFKMWDVRTGKVKAVFKGHTATIDSLAFSPDGTTIVSASADKTVRLWDVKTAKEIRRFEGHIVPATRVVFSPNGRLIASCDGGAAIRIWDVATGRQIDAARTAPISIGALAVAPDGKTVLFGSGDRLVRLWDLETGEELARFEKHEYGVGAVAFSPDGKRALSGGRKGENGEFPVIHLWDMQTRKRLLTLSPQLRNDNTVLGLAFSPDGRRAVAMCYLARKTLRLWDLATGKLIRGRQPARDKPGGMFSRRPYMPTLAIDPTGSRAYLATRKIPLQAWDLETGAIYRAIGVPAEAEVAAITPDARLVLLCNTVGTVDAPKYRLGLYRFHAAQDPEKLKIKMEVLIARLGHDSFKEREAAQTELIRIGPTGAKWVGAAATGSDPELKARAKVIQATYVTDTIRPTMLGQLDIETNIRYMILNQRGTLWAGTTMRLARKGYRGVIIGAIDEKNGELKVLAKFRTKQSPTRIAFVPNADRLVVGYADGTLSIYAADAGGAAGE